jgi:hypothetical protein
LSEAAKTDTAEMRYLLGDLSEDEKIRMEEGYFSDDSSFEEIELAEDELIDSYVRNQLSPEEQRQFKVKLLGSLRLRERVNFASALAEKADSYLSPEAKHSIERMRSFSSALAKPRTRWWVGFFAQQPAWGMAMAAIIIVASVILVFSWLRLQDQSGRLAAERGELQRQRQELEKQSGEQRAKTDQLSAELQSARDQHAEDQRLLEESQRASNDSTNRRSSLSTFATLLLMPGLSRGGGDKSQLTIGTQTTAARIQLVLESDDYPTYTAEIKTADAKVIFRKQNLKPYKMRSGSHLLLSVPAQLLRPNDYVIHVDGINSAGQIDSVSDYAFRVVE